jgi:hypothetical protein
VKVGNSSRCCKFQLPQGGVTGFDHLLPLFRAEREGVETGTSQKTCPMQINDFAAYGGMGGQSTTDVSVAISPAFLARCKIAFVVLILSRRMINVSRPYLSALYRNTPAGVRPPVSGNDHTHT